MKITICFKNCENIEQVPGAFFDPVDQAELWERLLAPFEKDLEAVNIIIEPAWQ